MAWRWKDFFWGVNLPFNISVLHDSRTHRTHLHLFQMKAGQQDNTEVEVARCSRGQYFGELALVTNKPRAASVYAVGETKCLGRLKTEAVQCLCFFVSGATVILDFCTSFSVTLAGLLNVGVAVQKAYRGITVIHDPHTAAEHFIILHVSITNGHRSCPLQQCSLVVCTVSWSDRPGGRHG